jgi:transcriptional regulator with XRE-family HTH domain
MWPEFAGDYEPPPPPAPPDLTTFHGRLAWLPGALGLSQVAFAVRLGVSQATFNNWAHGSTPTKPLTQLELIERIHEEFPQVTREWLAWGDENSLTDKRVGMSPPWARIDRLEDVHNGYGNDIRYSRAS